MALSPTQDTSPNAGQDPQFRIRVDVTGEGSIEGVVGIKNRKKDGWIQIRSRNFLVVGDASEKDLRLAASELELFRSQFARIFPQAQNASSVPTRVVVFRDSDSIRRFRPLNRNNEVDEKQPDLGKGYLQPATDLNYIVLEGGEQLPGRVIREYVRLLTRDSISPVPLWFQVGLEEYFSTYRLSRLGDDRVIKISLEHYKGNAKEKRLFPLTLLFSVNRDSYEFADAETKKVFDAEACALFHFMVQTRRTGAMVRFINAVAEGKPMASSFRDAFNLGLPAFEENFKQNIKVNSRNGWTATFVGLSINRNKKVTAVLYGNGPFRVPVNFDSVRADVEGLPARELSDAEAEYFRGDLLLHNNRIEEAGMYLQNAIRLDSELAAAHTALGMVQTLQNAFGAARDTLDLAIVLNAKSHLPYFYASQLIQSEAATLQGGLSDRDVASVRAMLTKSVTLAPEFVESSEMLAESHLKFHGNLALAGQLLLHGLQHSPGRQSLLMMLARVTIEGKDPPSAGWMLQRVIASGATDASMRQDARDLLAKLNLTDAQRTAFGEFAITSAVLTPLSKMEIGKKSPTGSGEAEKVVRGILNRVDCSKGLTIYIDLGERDVDLRTENLHTDTPANVDWVTDTGEEIGAISCETTRARPVTITYRPKRKGLMMGEPLVVEFQTIRD